MNKEICKNIENLFTSSIYPDCPKKDLCDNGQYDFSKKPKMPYIGIEYGNNPQIPNLLFISLDSGNPGTENNIEEIRNHVKNNPPRIIREKGDKVKHWYQTFDIASLFLDKYLDESIKKEEFYTDKFFAHTNSAKCSQRKENRVQADDKLFNNCREFVINEIPLFNADIIITQGNQAWNSLFKFEIKETFVLETIHNGKEVKLSIYIREVNNKKTLHIPMYHPRNGRYWAQKTAFKDNLDKIVDIIKNMKN